MSDASVWCRGESEELDVDMVHAALQEFQQELREAQRDRVSFNLTTEHRFKDTNRTLCMKRIVDLKLILLFRSVSSTILIDLIC